MLKRITTRNSVYEVDTTAKRVRRLSGDSPAASEKFTGREWRDLMEWHLVNFATGEALILHFNNEDTLVTSLVRNVEDVAE